jgi:MFS family permease
MDKASRNVAQLALAQALMMSVNTLLITASSIIGFQLASNKALATLPLALQFLATMLTSIPASMMMRRYGRKAGFLFSSGIGLIGGLLAIEALLSGSFILFCIATMAFGVYTGFGNYFRFVATEVSPPDRANKAISYVLAGGVLAAVIGPNLANHSRDLLDTAFLGSFIAVCVLYLLNLFNFLGMDLPRPVNPGIDAYSRPLKQIMQQPLFIAALVAAAIGYSAMSLLMTATPLAMMHEHHPFSDVAFVIQWHVLGMFVPSFFTGHLIDRFGAVPIIVAGIVSNFVCIAINLTGQSITHFWLALFLLGLGWNFMFIGGTTLLTRCYNEAEKAKTQAVNDFIVFTAMVLASLSAGALQHRLGWFNVNIAVLPVMLATLFVVLFLNAKRSPPPAID